MADSGGKTSSSRRRKWLRWLAWAIFIYTVVGFLILPPIIRAVAVKQLAKQLNREVSIEKVRLNPYALSVAVRGLLIKDKDGQPFVSWDEVYVNFQLSSLIGKAWAFKEVSVTKPYFRVLVNKDGTINFADLFAKSSPAETNAPSKPFALWVGKITIDGARVSLTDLTPRRPFERTLGPMTVSLNEFRTDPESKNPYTFEATTDAGGKLAWSGYFRLDPVRSQGRFLIENIALGKYAALYEDLVKFRVKDGAVDIGAEYHIELNPTNRIASVTNALFALRSLKLGVADSDVNIAELEEFSVKGASVDVTKQWAEINSISSRGGKFILQRDTNAALNVVEAAKPTEGAAANAPRGVTMLLQSVTNAVAALINQTNQWTGIVRELNIHDDTVIWEDLVNSRPARMQVDQISFSAKNISNYPGTNVTTSLSFRWNTNGTIKVDADAIFTPLTVDFKFALEDLELRPLDPYLEPMLDLFLVDGKFGTKGTAHLGVKEGELPELKISADAWLNDFATVDGRFTEDLAKWRSLRISGVEANLDPMEVSIKEIALNDAFVKLVIETNKISNLAVVLRSVDTNTVAATPSEGKKEEESKTVAAAPSDSAKTPDAKPLKLSVASIVLSNAQARLVDRSVVPAVNTGVQQFGGTISGISLDEQATATINLSGKVDNTGPVEINGTLKPLGKNLTTDLKIALKNMDLTPVSPYSGKYAGYSIAKGKLGFDLDYKIADRKLVAKNFVVIDQFTFGQKVNSPDATKLPVKLGVAVMKDRKGVIELDVPIEGSLDDPKFHVGGVVARAVLNVVTKVLTSPFSVIGAAFGGGGEELGYQDFAPGSTVLAGDGVKKLDSLVKALQERPTLELEIEGSIDAEADRAGLRRLKLAKEIRTRIWMTLRQSQRSAQTPEEMTVSAEDAATWLNTLYNSALEKGEIALTVPATNQTTGLAPATVASKPETGKGAAALLPQRKSAVQSSGTAATTTQAADVKPRRAQDANEMAQALMTAIPVTDDDFKELATSRAKAVREYILRQNQAVSDRIFMTETQSGGVKTQGSRAYLQLR